MNQTPARISIVVVAAILIAGVTLVMSEVFVRLVAGSPATLLYSGAFRDRQTDWDLVYGVTADGLRITCEQQERRNPEHRLAIIGDSFAFGQGVPDCSTVASRLSALLPDTNIANYGLIGIGIDYYLMIARDMIPTETSDVLVLFYGNDVSQAIDQKSLFGTLADLSSTFGLLRRAKRAFTIQRFIAANEQNDGGAHQSAFNNITSIINEDPDYFMKIANPREAEKRAFRRDFLALMDRLSRIVPRSNIYIAVAPDAAVISPTVRQFVAARGGNLPEFGQRGSGYDLIRALSFQEKVNFIDLFPTFREMGSDAYFEHDMHWNWKGHELAAHTIATAINPHRSLSATRTAN